jgi:hypothetical protein
LQYQYETGEGSYDRTTQVVEYAETGVFGVPDLGYPRLTFLLYK